MNTLYATATQIVDTLKAKRLETVHLSAELAQAVYDLQVAQARVERGLIKKMGNEKALGYTVESRSKVFTLALDADKDYQARLKRRNEVELKLKEARVEVAYLKDRLNVMLSMMKVEESSL